MGRTKNRDKYKRICIYIQSLLQWPYHLPQSDLSKGIIYTEQKHSWDCGPNSAGRALQMWSKNPKDFSNYDELRSHCPKLFGSPQTKSGQNTLNICNFLTLGISAIITHNITDVGPSPSELANYISKNIKGVGRGIFSRSQNFETTLNEIKTDLANGDPVIALISWSSFRMHYINIVAVSDKDDIAIIDTDNSLYYYSKSDFEDLMDCRSYIPHNVILSNYNLIRFKKF